MDSTTNGYTASPVSMAMTSSLNFKAHTYRFHGDPDPKLTTYKVFYDDHGNYIKSTTPSPAGYVPKRSPSVGTLRQEFKPQYGVRPTNARWQSFGNTDSGSILAGTSGAPGGSTTGSGGSPTQSALRPWTSTLQPGPAPGGTIRTGPLHSTLPPRQYKYFMTEYNDEYRTPSWRRDTLSDLTVKYGTTDALKTSRYRIKQSLPNYETRVVAF